MATFQVTDSSDTYTCALDGSGKAQKNGADFGTWSTNRLNQIVVTPTGTSALAPIAVSWQFNDKNELCVTSSGKQTNLHDGGRPRYDLLDSVLTVRPAFTGVHQFNIHGEWDLESDLKLSLTTPDQTKSTIDGSLNDLRSRFVYRFGSLTKGREDQTALLVFVGAWSKDATDPAKLNFTYKRERQADGTQSSDIFVLPGSFEFAKGTNQIVYRFANGKHQVALVGTLRVSPNFQITYSVGTQVSSGNVTQVAASDIVIDAVFANPTFSGDLSLQVQRPGGGVTTFAIGGHFTHVRKSGTQIGVGFSIAGGSGATPTVVAFQGSFALANNGKLSFTFARNAVNTTITFAADQVRLGAVTINASATVVMSNGKVQSVEAMFGFTFPLQALGASK